MKSKKNLIEAKDIKAGMIIGRTIREDYDDIMLIIAKTGFTKVEYTYLDYQDGQDAFCGSIDGKEKVKVFKGKRREYIFKHIRNDVFKNLHDAQNKVDIIRLIEDMTPRKRERKKTRYTIPVTFSSTNNYGKTLDTEDDVYTIEEFLKQVKEGAFIDSDGYGHPVKDNLADKTIDIYPSTVDEIPKDATHVIWYNK